PPNSTGASVTVMRNTAWRPTWPTPMSVFLTSVTLTQQKNITGATYSHSNFMTSSVAQESSPNLAGFHTSASSTVVKQVNLRTNCYISSTRLQRQFQGHSTSRLQRHRTSALSCTMSWARSSPTRAWSALLSSTTVRRSGSTTTQTVTRLVELGSTWRA